MPSHDGTGQGHLTPVLGNLKATEHKDILDICVLTTLHPQFQVSIYHWPYSAVQTTQDFLVLVARLEPAGISVGEHHIWTKLGTSYNLANLITKVKHDAGGSMDPQNHWDRH